MDYVAGYMVLVRGAGFVRRGYGGGGVSGTRMWIALLVEIPPDMG